jgi:hypothetical protein
MRNDNMSINDIKSDIKELPENKISAILSDLINLIEELSERIDDLEYYKRSSDIRHRMEHGNQ